MKQFYLISLLLNFLCVNIFAQSSGVKDVMPLAPNTAALFKLAERPAGSFTGTVPVSFPLMTVNSGPLQINLSLDYSTSGIRVEEVPGSVGLGFNFNDGGGRIVEMVNGKSDNGPNGITNPSNSRKPSQFDPTNSNHLMDAYMDILDLEPDVFKYSFAGHSGRFYFNENRNIIHLSDNGLKIEESSGGFKITDSKGTEYHFKTESTSLYSYGDGSKWLPGGGSRTWYLTDIYDMNHENNIKFTYVSSGGSFIGFSSGSRVLGSMLCQDVPAPNSSRFVLVGGTELILAKVEGRSGYVLCNSSADRLDLEISRKINSLEGYDSTSVLKKKFKFNYGYSGLPNSKRLMLANFSEFGSGTTDSLVHKFDYESGNLPPYDSNGVDFWGYYNGRDSNPHRFTDLVYLDNSFLNWKDIKNEVDLTPYPNHAKIQSLSKITYPTGGYRQFIYEGNIAPQQVNFYQFVPDPDYTILQTFKIDVPLAGGAGSQPTRKFFTVNSTYGGSVFSAYVNTNSSSFTIKLYRTNFGNNTGGTEVVPQRIGNVFKWILTNATYRLDVTNTGAFINGVDGKWNEFTLAEGSSYNRKVGGIRIKEVRDYDPVSNKFNIIKYEYKKYAKDSTISSGQLVLPLRVANREYATPICTYLRLNAVGNYQLTNEAGAYVVYPEVRTIEIGNGWYDSIYSFEGDYIIPESPEPPAVNNSAFRGKLLNEKIYSQNGTLLKHKVYKYETIGSGISVQKGLRVKPIFGVDNGVYRRTFYPQSSYPFASAALYSTWYVNDVKLALTYAIDSLFSSSGVNITRTDYSYERGVDYFLPKQVNTTTSSGAVKEVNYRYASTPDTEFVFGLTTDEQMMKMKLFNKNYREPLEITNTLKPAGVSSILLGGTKFIFGNFNSTKLHLSSVKEYTSISDFRETFLSSYDDKGNVREKYIHPSLTEVYLWGYNGRYPVARVIGSNINNVLAGVDLSILNHPLDDVSLRTHLNDLRVSLSTAHVETFTYNPGIGISSSTDAKGLITYYEYDQFGRLKTVKDQKGNIIKSMTYHYQF